MRIDGSLLDDICECSLDYIRYADKRFNSENVTDYVCEFLLSIYGSKFKKYIYPEIIEQIICNKFPYLNNKKFLFKLTDKSKQRLKDRFKILKDKPQAKQRSKEWYDKRFNTIGASELASIFGKSPFTSYPKYLLKKIGYEAPKKNDSLSIHCLHGIRYEDIAIMLYELRNNVDVHEFGSIDDESIDYLAASPDGITPSGTMLEIKCPLSRNIIGIPPIYYWYQMQQQLKVCKLNKCDFLECKIVEYNCWNEYKEDNYNGDYSKNSLNLEKGAIIEYINIGETDPWAVYGYIYPPKITMSNKEIINWKNNICKGFENDQTKMFARIIFWKLELYSCIPVYRNKLWWKNNFKIINDFWGEVLFYRGIGYESLLKKTVKRKKISKVNDDYMFISDSD